jgi:uncharacterized protein YjbK
MNIVKMFCPECLNSIAGCVTKDYKIDTHCFSIKHILLTIRIKNGWLRVTIKCPSNGITGLLSNTIKHQFIVGIAQKLS